VTTVAPVTIRDVSEKSYSLRRYAERLSAAEAGPCSTPASSRARTLPAGHSADPRSGASEDPIAAVLELVRDRLGLDVAFVGKFEDGQETFPVVAGPVESFGIEPIALEGRAREEQRSAKSR